MSFSTPEIKNPAKRFYEFKSDEKSFVYFDKSLDAGNGSKGKKVAVTLPCYLIILDTLHCVTGFSDANQCGFHSNEVRNIKKDALLVKTFKGDYRESGLWDDIQGNVKAAGGDYTRSCYCLLIEKDASPVLVNFKFSRIALNALIEFEKSGFNPRRHMLRIENKFLEGKKGKVVYNTPVFSKIDLTNTDLIDAALKSDEELQIFLKDYLNKSE